MSVHIILQTPQREVTVGYLKGEDKYYITETNLTGIGDKITEASKFSLLEDFLPRFIAIAGRRRAYCGAMMVMKGERQGRNNPDSVVDWTKLIPMEI